MADNSTVKPEPSHIQIAPASDTAWQFYHDGVYGPAEESELRRFSEQLGMFSDAKGIAAVVMKQMWSEIDRLRARVKELEDGRPHQGD